MGGGAERTNIYIYIHIYAHTLHIRTHTYMHTSYSFPESTVPEALNIEKDPSPLLRGIGMEDCAFPVCLAAFTASPKGGPAIASRLLVHFKPRSISRHRRACFEI